MFHFKKCDGCDKDLPLGTSRYTVRVEITSDFDGFLPETDDGDPEEALCSVLDQIDRMTEEELEDDVHLEAEMTLCKSCRDKLVESIEDLGDGDSAEARAKARANLH